MIRDILTIPDNLDVEGAEEVKLTDASEFMKSLPANPEGPAPEVYEYRVTKLPAHEILSMSVVRDLVVSLIQDVEACRTDPRCAHFANDDEFRVWLMDETPVYQEFFKKHPHLFRRIACKAPLPPREKKFIMEMIAMKQKHLENNVPLEQCRMESGKYMRDNFSRPARPGEEEEAVRNGTGYSGTPMTAEQVKADLKKGK